MKTKSTIATKMTQKQQCKQEEKHQQKQNSNYSHRLHLHLGTTPFQLQTIAISMVAIIFGLLCTAICVSGVSVLQTKHTKNYIHVNRCRIHLLIYIHTYLCCWLLNRNCPRHPTRFFLFCFCCSHLWLAFVWKWVCASIATSVQQISTSQSPNTNTSTNKYIFIHLVPSTALMRRWVPS